METMNELTCAEMVEILSDYFEGVLGTDYMKLCAEHLANCEACEEYYRGLVYAIRIAGGMRAGAVTAPPMEQLTQLFRQRQNQ